MKRKRNGGKPVFCESKNAPIKESDCWKYWKTTKRRKVKKSLSNGKKIEVDIKSIYDSDKSTKRPLGFFVEYKIDGIEQSPIYHYN